MDWHEKYVRRKYGMSVEAYHAQLAMKANVKMCRKCHVEKPLGEFREDARNTGNIGKGVTSWCRLCLNEKEAAWKAANPERAKAGQKAWHDAHKAEQRDKYLRRTYGISAPQYDALLAAQGGHCAICPATEPGGAGKMFHVDHDHRTGRVRGLLCHACNTVLTEHLEKHITAIASYLAAAGLKNLLLDRFESSDNLPDIPNGGNPPGAEDERAGQGEVRDV